MSPHPDSPPGELTDMKKRGSFVHTSCLANFKFCKIPEVISEKMKISMVTKDGERFKFRKY